MKSAWIGSRSEEGVRFQLGPKAGEERGLSTWWGPPEQFAWQRFVPDYTLRFLQAYFDRHIANMRRGETEPKKVKAPH